MAGSVTPSVFSINLARKVASTRCESCQTKLIPSFQKIPGSFFSRINPQLSRISSKRLNAGLSEIEPDLNEDFVDRWRTNGIEEDDFKFGYYDDHHTYYEGDDKGTFWGSIAEGYAAMGPPTGFQGLISWLFLPAIAAGMYFNVPGEYLYIGAVVFAAVFCIIEMGKPSEPHNFEPQIYNMERGARDKLINDYNTMDIWDFNEKYGDLWDFTVTKDDIMKR
ncbi:photosynthetic NDH subunit of subcomplex B 5, chloroplastic [Coffea eugenioides]|uniref:Photosynthetic NDH subunit of subcomplex B 5, chloroplastic n=1 Tax=Coffea arabica TaxID=13443 RepID=A0ABM4X905_COFAR|nr:photosynthetic NDH subunit of subcomplex B 5, chloroplastic [Coffea arabica]XP_027165033.1 photosynthetic NDH subunit of subcomplex B 5, chloroplastic [Coffea eugenioides]